MTPIRTSLCLIRHGQTTWNRDGRWQGHADPELTEAGRDQARLLGEALAGELAEALAGDRDRPPWTRLYSSDLLRARATAEAIAARIGLPIELDRRLRELDVGDWCGLTRSEIERRDAATLAAFERGEPGVRPGGGETRIEIRERSHAFVCAVAARHPGERILVVTHLGVIRALVPGARPENAARFELVAEEVAERPIDRAQRREEGPL